MTIPILPEAIVAIVAGCVALPVAIASFWSMHDTPAKRQTRRIRALKPLSDKWREPR